MAAAGIDQDRLKEMRADIDIINKTGKEEREGSSGVAFAVGYASGFIIYIILLVFGMSVMRGVMEEKMNRIAEVVVSSVKPFQLMMGKILGIAGVGLTQFIIWVGLIIAIYSGIMLAFSPSEIQSAQAMQGGNSAASAEMIRSMKYVAGSVN